MRRLNREVNNGHPNHQHIGEQTSESQRLTTHKSRSRKAANLAELQRYFDAAAEAASEVMQLESASKIKIDLKHLANAGIKPLDSPSRMVAVNLASSNATFREKFRQKLEASGGIACKINVSSEESTVVCISKNHRHPQRRSKITRSPADKDCRLRKRKELSITIDDDDNFSLTKCDPPKKRTTLNTASRSGNLIQR